MALPNSLKSKAFLISNQLYTAQDGEKGTLKEFLGEFERDVILNMMVFTTNQSEAAKKLGISRSALIYKLQEYGVVREQRTENGGGFDNIEL